MSNADHAAMVDGDILLFTLPQSAYIYRKSRTAHAPSNFLEVGVRLLETGEDAAIGDRNFRSRLYVLWFQTCVEVQSAAKVSLSNGGSLSSFEQSHSNL